MRAAGTLQRFVDPRDVRALLDMLSDFAQTVLAYELQLSPDLQELDRLVQFLQPRSLAARA
jgi:cell division septum initiation protein DivIVA